MKQSIFYLRIYYLPIIWLFVLRFVFVLQDPTVSRNLQTRLSSSGADSIDRKLKSGGWRIGILAWNHFFTSWLFALVGAFVCRFPCWPPRNQPRPLPWVDIPSGRWGGEWTRGFGTMIVDSLVAWEVMAGCGNRNDDLAGNDEESSPYCARSSRNIVVLCNILTTFRCTSSYLSHLFFN